MTICIAAVCEKGSAIVVAADQMFTLGPPLNVEFEPPISKVESVGETCLVMGSGNSLAVAEILAAVRASHGTATGPHISDIANSTKDGYVRFREKAIDEQLLRPSLGPDFETFRQRGGTLPAYLQPQPQIYGQIYMQSSQFNLNSEIIVTGLDDSGSHVFVVSHPGQVICFDKIGYGVTGSGAPHASIKLALELQHPESPLADTLVSVYSAKKAAEVAPGVGKETEMFVITNKGSWKLPEEMFKKLDQQIEKTKKAKPSSEGIGAEYERLRGNH